MNLKMNVSTIMPLAIRGHSLANILSGNTEVYYSLYSVDDKFRRHWMPNTMHYHEALTMLKEYQLLTKKKITLHWAVIEGHNDSLEDVERLVNVVKDYELVGKFNLVRYNPPNEFSKEASEERLNEILGMMKYALSPALFDKSQSKIVSRVGMDVYASCGTFINDLDR